MSFCFIYMSMKQSVNYIEEKEKIAKCTFDESGLASRRKLMIIRANDHWICNDQEEIKLAIELIIFTRIALASGKLDERRKSKKENSTSSASY